MWSFVSISLVATANLHQINHYYHHVEGFVVDNFLAEHINKVNIFQGASLRCPIHMVLFTSGLVLWISSIFWLGAYWCKLCLCDNCVTSWIVHKACTQGCGLYHHSWQYPVHSCVSESRGFMGLISIACPLIAHLLTSVCWVIPLMRNYNYKEFSEDFSSNNWQLNICWVSYISCIAWVGNHAFFCPDTH